MSNSWCDLLWVPRIESYCGLFLLPVDWSLKQSLTSHDRPPHCYLEKWQQVKGRNIIISLPVLALSLLWFVFQPVTALALSSSPPLPLCIILYDLFSWEITLQMHLPPHLPFHMAGRWHKKPSISVIGWGTVLLVCIQYWGMQNPTWGGGKGYSEQSRSSCLYWEWWKKEVGGFWGACSPSMKLRTSQSYGREL